MHMLPIRDGVRLISHAHLFCGLGGGAQGFRDAHPRAGPLVGRYINRGGIDSDAGALENFELLTGVKGTLLDLFDREQYVAFHEELPPAGWREATPDDILRTFGARLDVLFMSAPCKGLSGLLSTAKSKTAKYQALNRLTVRGVWLTLEAYKDDPIPIILFENVPRIQNRGKPLLEEIKALLRGYGYIVNEDVHDCGEIGELAQTRNRYLLIARHPLKIPGFVYQPPKHKLRGVGEVIGRLPLPGDPVGGVMHRVPALQWQTWVRLAFVEAGKDWRSLNRLRVVDGKLQDYGLIPETEDGEPWRDNALGVLRWADDFAPTIIGNQRSPYQGRFSVADPRIETDREGSGRLGVRDWTEPSGTVAGASRVENGAYSVADPRPGVYYHHGAFGVVPFDKPAGLVAAASRPANGPHAVADPRFAAGGRSTVMGVTGWADPAAVVAGESYPTNGAFSVADPRPLGASWNDDVLGVRTWEKPSGTIPGRTAPSNGTFSVADPRIDGHEKSVQLGVRTWSMTAPCVKGDMSVGTGPYAIADIRIVGKPRFNSTFRVVRYEDSSPAVAGPGGPAGGLAVADPRPSDSGAYESTKYKVTPYDAATRAVLGASTTGDGAFAVADPRDGRESAALHGKYPVEIWIGPSRAVIGGRDQGAYAVADPRVSWGRGRHQNVLRITPADQPVGTIPANAHSVTGGQPCVADDRREHYQTGGHYGVLPWADPSLSVSASACHDNGFNSVADPRRVILEPRRPIELPKAKEKLVCRIVAEDGTWHRPFTTLELASLQSLFDPEEAFGVDPETGLWIARKGFELHARSDSMRREWIGNAVPSAAAKGMAETIGETILLASVGEGRILDTRSIWVKPLALALAVDSRQPALELDAML